MRFSRADLFSVACRELKTRLGTYLRQVKDGAIVTERRRPVGELRPAVAGGDLETRLDRLAATGLVTREVREVVLPDFRPIEAPGSASEAVIEDRKDRF